MSRGLTDIAKGAGLGMAIGAVAGFAGSCVMSSRRHSMRRKAKNAAGMVGDVLDNISFMFK